MNQFAPNSPRPKDEESGQSEPASEGLEDSTPTSHESSPVHDAGLVDTPESAESSDLDNGDPDSAEVRIGSPFAVDPFGPEANREVEAFYDVGPLKYTAMGAVSASVLVLGFAAAAAYFFPVGGTLIAALGCGLSIFGMYSSYRLTAAGLLALHLCLFVVSYGRTLG